jgi:hypothetical protein
LALCVITVGRYVQIVMHKFWKIGARNILLGKESSTNILAAFCGAVSRQRVNSSRSRVQSHSTKKFGVGDWPVEQFPGIWRWPGRVIAHFIEAYPGALLKIAITTLAMTTSPEGAWRRRDGVLGYIGALPSLCKGGCWLAMIKETAIVRADIFHHFYPRITFVAVRHDTTWIIEH